MERSTIKLEANLINKIKEIQEINGYKSVNETVKHLLPSGTSTPEEYIKLETEILKKDEKIENYEKLIYDIDERLRNIEKKEENFKENDFEDLLI